MCELMKAAVMPKIGQLAFEMREIPSPGTSEVLVKLEYVGICGSDMHYYEHGRIGDFIVEPPFVLGHEASGTVVEVGSGVTHLQKGDRVALEPGKTCGHCEYCRKGLYNLCPDVIFFATPPVDGVFCEYVAHDAALCFKLPDNVSTLEGALIEPLSVGFHAATLGGARIGQKAVVTGAGCIGLVSLMALKAAGVNEVYVVDVIEKRLQKALHFGAKAVIDATKTDVIEKVLALTDGKGVDLVIETSGSEKAAALSFQYCGKAATVVLVGYSPSGDMTLPMATALNNELVIKTVFRYRHMYPLAIEAASSGKIDLKSIVTHEFTFDDLPNAMARSAREKADVVKAVIRF